MEMKKTAMILLSIALAAGVVTGCVKTPEEEETPVTPTPTPTPDPDDPEPDGKEAFEPTIISTPFSWIATDGQNNEIDPEEYPDPEDRPDKFVGIFYFLWHGCHGYDRGANNNSVVPPTASDTQSPYDIEKLLAANPTNPQYGGGGVMHHWGEPYLGYYVMDDEWVIRKHAQMLADAGVDVIAFDVTNGYHYLPVVKILADTFMKIRSEGNTTPQFMFLLNANAGATFDAIYQGIYGPGLYKDLWFNWLGKPLVLMDPNQVTGSYKNEFNYRQSWYLWNDSGADTWFGNGTDKWPWGGLYPQKAGRHANKNEQTYVLAATHPTSNIGRSYDPTAGGQPANPQSGKGIFFHKQFERAMDLDPKFMFFTGWNEWTAQKQVARSDGEAGFLGRTVKKGEPYFVDQYNHEFSRDMEPLNGDFGDNYYYMLVDFVRKFKGTKATPVFSAVESISIDGEFSEWESVKAKYGDNRGDVAHRDHYGWGSIGQYVNNTGRNDIVYVKVANDGTNLYFYARTKDDMTAHTDPDWMKLFIKVNGSSEKNWEGFNFAVNRTVASDKETVLEKSNGGYSWTEVTKVSYCCKEKAMEIAIPLSSLGIKDASEFTVDFKWIDNAASDGDIQTCMRDGDSAPNGRFRYRYSFKKQ